MKYLLAITLFTVSATGFAKSIEVESVELSPKDSFVTLKGHTEIPMYLGLKLENHDAKDDFAEIELEGVINNLAGDCPKKGCKFAFKFNVERFAGFPAHIQQKIAEAPGGFRPQPPPPKNLRGEEGLLIRNMSKSIKLAW